MGDYPFFGVLKRWGSSRSSTPAAPGSQWRPWLPRHCSLRPAGRTAMCSSRWSRSSSGRLRLVAASSWKQLTTCRNLTKYIRPLPLRRYLTHRGRARKYDALRHIFERAPPRGRSRAPLAPRALRAAIALRKPCECLTRLGLGSSPGRVDPPRIKRIQGGQVLLLHGLLYPRPLFSGFLLDAHLSSTSCAAAGAFERAVADSPRRTPRGEGGLCVFKRVL